MVNGEPHWRSVGFDATDRFYKEIQQNIVVTVGVLVSREQEATLLDAFYQTLYEDDYRPFRTKSRDLSIPSKKITDLLNRCNVEVGVCVHRDDVKLEIAEAVHSTILLDELSVSTKDTIAIVDGDRDRADRLYLCASTIDIVPPPVTNCVQSEFYYPHLLLADLVAGDIADTIAADLTIPSSDEIGNSVKMIRETSSREGRWGRGYNAVARSEGEVLQATYKQRYADSVQQRISCWFHGMFGEAHAPQPESDGVQPVVRKLNNIGCNDVATWLAEQ